MKTRNTIRLVSRHFQDGLTNVEKKRAAGWPTCGLLKSGNPSPPSQDSTSWLLPCRGSLRALERPGRSRALLFWFIVLCTALCLQASALSYSVTWYKIAGGGGSSTGSVYTVSGTIGQHEAGGPMTAGNYSLTGGFWAFSVAQTPGSPTLYIFRTGSSTAIVWWLPGSGSYTLQTNSNLSASGAWTAFGGMINSSGGTNSVTVSPATGNLFFRLLHP